MLIIVGIFAAVGLLLAVGALAFLFWLSRHSPADAPAPITRRTPSPGEWLPSGGWVRTETGADPSAAERANEEPTPKQLEFLADLHSELERPFSIREHAMRTRGEVSRTIEAMLAEKRQAKKED